MKVIRVRLLMGSVAGDLRRELDPYTVVVVRRDDGTLSQRTLDRLGGHQIAYVALVGVGALLRGVSGVSLPGSGWGSVSAVTTLGPSVGEIGAYGRLADLTRPAHLALVPLMMGGRMSIPPLLAGVGLILRSYKRAVRRCRYLARQLAERRFQSGDGDG